MTNDKNINMLCWHFPHFPHRWTSINCNCKLILQFLDYCFLLLLSFIVILSPFIFWCKVLWEFETSNYTETIRFRTFPSAHFLSNKREGLILVKIVKIVKNKQYHVDDHSHENSIDIFFKFSIFLCFKALLATFSVIINNKNMTSIMLLFNGYKTFIIIYVHNLHK